MRIHWCLPLLLLTACATSTGPVPIGKDTLHGSLSLAFVVHLPTGVLIVNVLALAMFAASAALLWWRLRGRKAGTNAAPVHSTYQ